MAGETRKMLAMLAMAAVLGACTSGDEETPAVGDYDATLAEDPATAVGPAVPNVETVPRPDQTMASGRLSPVNNSGITGSVNVRGIGERTEVAMNVTGLTEGTRQVDAGIVTGPCENSGGQVAPLGPITVGAGGIAAVTDTLDLPAGTVLNGAHAIVVRAMEAGPSVPPLACSPLPDWQAPPQAAGT